MVEGGRDKICCQTSLTKEHKRLLYAHQFDLVRPGKKMFCCKRSFSENFPCVEVIDRWLARNISPVFRCAPTQVTYTAPVYHCLCLWFTSVHRYCVPPTCVCVSLLCAASVYVPSTAIAQGVLVFAQSPRNGLTEH